MKIGNFGSFDDNLKKQGITGLTNASKLDKEIFFEFVDKWDELAFESEKLIAKYENRDLLEEKIEIPVGLDKEVVVKQRVNQRFFREAVLASYGGACCMTGLANPELLIASHIKPWKNSEKNERTNPKNGLCLNALHDKAFDRGFITVTKDYKIRISNSIKDIYCGEMVDRFFGNPPHTPVSIPL